MNRRSFGLTLIEVLIASVIVFGVVALTVDMYRSSLITTNKAQAEVQALLAVQMLLPRIQRDLIRLSSQDRVSAAGSYDGMRYSYEATSISFAPPPEEFDIETGMLKRFEPRFRLYNVRLSLTSKTGVEKTMNYRELAWTESAARAD